MQCAHAGKLTWICIYRQRWKLLKQALSKIEKLQKVFLAEGLCSRGFLERLVGCQQMVCCSRIEHICVLQMDVFLGSATRNAGRFR